MTDLQARLRYGLRAMLYLAENYRGEEPTKVRRIGAETAVPPKYLVHILLGLKRAALVNSTRGPSGGYWLLRRPALITVAEVVEAIEQDSADRGGPELVEVPYDHAINRLWQRMQLRRREFLSSITLADLLPEPPSA